MAGQLSDFRSVVVVTKSTSLPLGFTSGWGVSMGDQPRKRNKYTAIDTIFFYNTDVRPRTRALTGTPRGAMGVIEARQRQAGEGAALIGHF